MTPARARELKDQIHERLKLRCELDPATGCWVFIGAWESSGMGLLKVGGRLTLR